MKKSLLIALALVACGKSEAPESDNSCDLPYIGEYVAPPGAPCYVARAGDPTVIVILERDAPSCGSTDMGSCVADGCTSTLVRPGAIVDAWGDAFDPSIAVFFDPRSDCN
jgi:hypothetical protein